MQGHGLSCSTTCTAQAGAPHVTCMHSCGTSIKTWHEPPVVECVRKVPVAGCCACDEAWRPVSTACCHPCVLPIPCSQRGPVLAEDFAPPYWTIQTSEPCPRPHANMGLIHFPSLVTSSVPAGQRRLLVLKWRGRLLCSHSVCPSSRTEGSREQEGGY